MTATGTATGPPLLSGALYDEWREAAHHLTNTAPLDTTAREDAPRPRTDSACAEQS